MAKFKKSLAKAFNVFFVLYLIIASLGLLEVDFKRLTCIAMAFAYIDICDILEIKDKKEII